MIRKIPALALLTLIVPATFGATVPSKANFLDPYSGKLSVGSAYMNSKTGYAIYSSGNPDYGDPTSTLDYSAMRTGLKLSYEWETNPGIDSMEIYTVLATHEGTGTLYDIDYLNSNGAARWEATYGDAQRAGPDPSYVNRSNPPTMWSKTVSDVVDGGQFEIGIRKHTIKKDADNIKHQTSMGYNFRRSTAHAYGLKFLVEEYDYYGPGYNQGDEAGKDIASLSWDSSFLSIEYGQRIDYTITPGLTLRAAVTGSPLALFYGRDVHHLRTDLKKNPSIHFYGAGIGASAAVGADIDIGSDGVLSLNYDLSYYRTLAGGGTFRYADGDSDTSKLNEAYDQRHMVTLSLQYPFYP